MLRGAGTGERPVDLTRHEREDDGSKRKHRLRGPPDPAARGARAHDPMGPAAASGASRTGRLRLCRRPEPGDRLHPRLDPDRDRQHHRIRDPGRRSASASSRATSRPGSSTTTSPGSSSVLVGLLISAVYFIYTWTAMRGTLGMKVLGMQIGNAGDGKTLTMNQAIRRWVIIAAPSVIAQALQPLPALGATARPRGLRMVHLPALHDLEEPDQAGLPRRLRQHDGRQGDARRRLTHPIDNAQRTRAAGSGWRTLAVLFVSGRRRPR